MPVITQFFRYWWTCCGRFTIGITVSVMLLFSIPYIAVAQEWITYQSVPYNIQFDIPSNWEAEVDQEALIASGDDAVFVIASIEDASVSVEELFEIQIETLDLELNLDFDGEYEEIELGGGIFGLIGTGVGIIEDEDVDVIVLAAISNDIGYLAYIISAPYASDQEWDMLVDIITSLSPLTDDAGSAELVSSEQGVSPMISQGTEVQDVAVFGDEENDTIAMFIIGNTMFTLYHELGHALIDQLGVPVLGKEEDAVDGLAAILMIPEEGDEVADSLIIEAAEGYGLSDDRNEDFDDMAYWDSHSLDLQRYGAIHCLIYGSDPEGFEDLAAVLEMPENERARCPETYIQTSNSWGEVLAEHMRDGQQGGGAFVVEFEQPYHNISEDVVDMLRNSEVIDAVTNGLEEMLVLPKDIPVFFKSCDMVNAFYDPNTVEVTMCYELIDYFAQIIADDLAAN